MDFFCLFLEKTHERQHCEWEENNSGMRSSRYGVRLPSPRRRPWRLFPGPPPLIPPVPFKMLRLNLLQRSRKVFCKLHKRPLSETED